MAESKRKVRRVVHVKDDEEWERQFAEYAQTPIQDTGDFFRTKRRIEGGRIFVDSLTGEAILPDFRHVKCRCGRKMKIWLASRDPIIYAGRCPRCKGEHFVGDTAIEHATKRQEKEWLKKAKQKKKGRL